jgi:hypothetical protein
MEALNQRWKAPSTGNLRRYRSAPAVHAPPVETLEQSPELRGRQAHHAVLDAWPLEAALLELLVTQVEMQALHLRRSTL